MQDSHKQNVGQTAPLRESRPYRLGVALSGGGARGFAHAGALMAIEEAGLKPDVIAGVSAGSVIAVLYAGGIKPKDMPDIFDKTGFRNFARFKLGHGGIFCIDRFKDFIIKTIGGKNMLEDLAIPTYIGATDLDHGTPAVFSTGEIGPRMLASCSIPIVFKPVVIDGTSYVDGGVLRNLPSWIIRDKCETLIGINVSPMRPMKDYSSIIEVAMRTYNLMAKANQTADMELCDLAVEMSEIAAYRVFNLKDINKVFMSGYVHTRHALRKAGLWHPDSSNDNTDFENISNTDSNPTKK